MPYRVDFSRSCRRSMKKLPADILSAVTPHIDALAVNPRPVDTKKLRNRNAWRIRLGDYRVIYEIHDEVLLVLVIKIAHRREVYSR